MLICWRRSAHWYLEHAIPACSKGLDAAAQAAFEAFGGAGVDYVVHNAGGLREGMGFFSRLLAAGAG